MKMLLKIVSFITAFLLLRTVEINNLLWEYNIGITFAILDVNWRYALSKKMDIRSAGIKTGSIFFIFSAMAVVPLLLLELKGILLFALYILSNLSLQNLEFTHSSSKELFYLFLIRIFDLVLLVGAQFNPQLLYFFLAVKIVFLFFNGLRGFLSLRVFNRLELVDFEVSFYSIFHFAITAFSSLLFVV